MASIEDRITKPDSLTTAEPGQRVEFYQGSSHWQTAVVDAHGVVALCLHSHPSKESAATCVPTVVNAANPSPSADAAGA